MGINFHKRRKILSGKTIIFYMNWFIKTILVNKNVFKRVSSDTCQRAVNCGLKEIKGKQSEVLSNCSNCHHSPGLSPYASPPPQKRKCAPSFKTSGSTSDVMYNIQVFYIPANHSPKQNKTLTTKLNFINWDPLIRFNPDYSGFLMSHISYFIFIFF